MLMSTIMGFVQFDIASVEKLLTIVLLFAGFGVGIKSTVFRIFTLI